MLTTMSWPLVFEAHWLTAGFAVEDDDWADETPVELEEVEADVEAVVFAGLLEKCFHPKKPPTPNAPIITSSTINFMKACLRRGRRVCASR